eukprot:GHVN01058753.1.p1 GENE.GHVN01058753.1~~GHVN01058753.1.p1  ORF type:complete len:1009 (-),score=128.74 GHVN01058753.1:278-3304(-)
MWKTVVQVTVGGVETVEHPTHELQLPVSPSMVNIAFKGRGKPVIERIDAVRNESSMSLWRGPSGMAKQSLVRSIFRTSFNKQIDDGSFIQPPTPIDRKCLEEDDILYVMQAVSSLADSKEQLEEFSGVMFAQTAAPFCPVDDKNALFKSLDDVPWLKEDHIKSTPKPLSPTMFKTAFLTGATGFVGSQQLNVLLSAQTSVDSSSRPLEAKNEMRVQFDQVICLVRAESIDHGMERIKKCAVTAGWWKPEYETRIVPIVGDITDHHVETGRMGLAHDEWERVCQDADVVYHTASVVKFIGSYDGLRSTNSLSIVPVIRLCVTHKLKPLHYCSSLGQFPAYFATYQGEFKDAAPITEDSEPEADQMNSFFPPAIQGYAWSKWVADQVVTKVQSKWGSTVPICRYRLGHTYSCSKTGYMNKDDHTAKMLVAAMQQGMFPDGLTGPSTTSADTVCQLIVSASLNPNRRHNRYNIINTIKHSTSHIESWSRELGVRLQPVTAEQFIAGAEKLGRRSILYWYLPLLKLWQRHWWAKSSPGEPADVKPLPVRTDNIFDDAPGIVWPDLRHTLKTSLLYSILGGWFPVDSQCLYTTVEECIESACEMSGIPDAMQLIISAIGRFRDERETRCDGEENTGTDYLLKPIRLILETDMGQTGLPNFAARLSAFRTFRQYYCNIIYMADNARNFPHITNLPITKPIFICGLNRSGTTFLQRLFFQDKESIRTPVYCEMITPFGKNGSTRPVGVANDSPWPEDSRVEFAQELLDYRLGVSEDWQAVHQQGPALPDEDMLIMEHVGRCYSLCCPFDLPTYRRWLLDDDKKQLRSAYRFHKQFLQHLQHQRGGELRWLLKMPFHLFTLDSLFEMYPDAEVIMMHRDPCETLPSWCNLVRLSRSLLTDGEPSISTIASEEVEAMSSMIASAMAVRRASPHLADKFHDVKYESFIADPSGTVENLYKRLGLSFTPQVKQRMEDFICQDERERVKKKQRLGLTDVGLEEGQVKAAFDDYYKSGMFS